MQLGRQRPKKSNDDLARDFVAFERGKTMLIGRYAPGTFNQDMLNTLHPLAAVVYCLTEKETIKALANQPLTLVNIDPPTIGLMLNESVYPAPLVPYLFDKSEVAHLYTNEPRLRHWLTVTTSMPTVRWLLAHWMPSANDKGALYASMVI